MVLGLPVPLFSVIAALVAAAVTAGVVPGGMVGALAFMLTLGAACAWAGDRLPVVKDYLGGGAIVAIFLPAGLLAGGLLPEGMVGQVRTFMTAGGFLDFYICALITGSILGMERRLLLNAALGYLPALAGCIVVALGGAALGGWLAGLGARDAVLFVGLPVIGGGLGAGAVPLAAIFGEGSQRAPAELLSQMMPAVALGNTLSIVLGAALDRLGRLRPALTGNGRLLRRTSGAPARPDETEPPVPELIAGGLLLSAALYCAGHLLATMAPSVHAYAWMILAVAVVKSTGLLPPAAEHLARCWFRFIMNNFTTVLLVGIGLAFTDLGQVIEALTPGYLLVVGLTVLGAVTGAAVVGWAVGFFPVEAALSAGLCMTNMGGTGDVAVLSAARRMELLPFAQISSRIGGAMVLLLASVILRLLP